MQQRDVSLVFDMLPTQVQSLMPNLQYVPLSTTLSILSPWRQLAGHDDGEIVTGQEKVNCMDRAADDEFELDRAEVEEQSETQIRQQAQQASTIRWRYAEQGTSMHRIAYLEKGDPVFSRKSYIDGVAYMLMALPDDLSRQETTTLRKALPPTIIDSNFVVGARGQTIHWQLIPDGRRTILRRCVASFVAVLVILIHLALMCMATVVRVVTHYERKHAIVRRIVSRGFIIAAAVGGHSVVLSAKIYGMREGRVGKVVNNIVTWTVENVSYGIQEGLGEGLTMVDKGLKVG
ncbi:hypothetical protein GGS21DRAFT_225683 [Xylaria nigripes]|nr:hypothetical protein GGS21DRAFT_225683 [Xylaria nigripes]